MPFLVILVLFWFIAVLTSMEMATFSARRERMVQVAQSGDRRGTLVNAYQRAPADYLSAIQLLATAANFVIGAMIGANIEAPVRAWFDNVLPGLGYRTQLSWTVSMGIVTIVALIFTNVLPKHIGFVRANEIAVKSAPLMRFWIKASWPITLFVRRATKLLARGLKIAPDERYRVTERDIDHLLMEGLRAGSLDPTEQAVMRRALRLSDTPVSEVMVPRDKALWIEPDWGARKIEAFCRKHGRSNYPVAKGGLDHVVGIMRALEWFLDKDLAATMDAAVFADADDSLLEAMELLRPSETRLLIVRRGEEVVGLLTLNDILGAIVGPIKQT